MERRTGSLLLALMLIACASTSAQRMPALDLVWNGSTATATLSNPHNSSVQVSGPSPILMTVRVSDEAGLLTNSATGGEGWYTSLMMRSELQRPQSQRLQPGERVNQAAAPTEVLAGFHTRSRSGAMCRFQVRAQTWTGDTLIERVSGWLEAPCAELFGR
jgi:hypothetical protein